MLPDLSPLPQSNSGNRSDACASPVGGKDLGLAAASTRDPDSSDRDNGVAGSGSGHASGVQNSVNQDGRTPVTNDRMFRELNITVVAFDELSPELLQRWEELRRGSDQWAQPFFAARFSAAVQQARGDVLVAVISAAENVLAEPHEAVGFLPFHRVGRVAVPVGRFLNDAQNVIGLPSKQVNWTAILAACDVIAFDFHAITNPDSSWTDEYHLQSVGAFRADFAGDSPGYLKQLEKDHRTIGKQGQKTRKLGREIGAVRLEVDCRCPEVLAQAIAWKREQYQRTHILDLFLPDWTRRLVEVLHGESSVTPPSQKGDNKLGRNSQALPPAAGESTFENLEQEPLRGLISVLWAGEQVIAAHYGMIERGRLHYWFPTYDPEFARYSPGTALFTELVRAATEYGIDCIDMGYGEQPYKQKQTATATQVALGTITHSRWHRFSYNTHRQLVGYLKRMPMKETVKRAWRAVNPTAGIKKLG